MNPSTADFKKAARERLKGKTRDELAYTVDDENVSGWDRQAAADMLRDLDHFEVIRRLDAIEKPHWTTAPGFWATVIGVILAGLAAWFGWLAVRTPPDAIVSPPPSSLSTPPLTTPPSSATPPK
jgi:hypothetical protein